MTWVTGTAVGNNMTRIGWSSKLHRETQDRFFFNEAGLRRMDTGDEPTFERRPGVPIIAQEILNGARAQQVRVGLMKQLTTGRSATTGTRSPGTYQYGTADLIDNEEQMEINSFTAWVEQMKHATSFHVPEIQDLRTEFKMTVQAADVLADWIAAEMEESALDAPYDQFSAHCVSGLTLTTADPPTANQAWANKKAADAELTSTDRLTAAELRRMFAWADVNNINPIRMGKDEVWVLLCHTYNYNDLWQDEAFTRSFEHGWQRAKSKDDNPLFSNADAIFGNILIYKYNRIRASSTNGNVRRCLLLGADAISEGVTSRPRLVRRKEDKYEDLFGLAVKAINGWARADYAPTSGTTINQSLCIWGLYTDSSV